MHGLRRAIGGLGLAALVAGCGLPRDPDGTLARVERGTLRVGVIDERPWSVAERRLVEGLAAWLGARVVWSTGGETRLMALLEQRELDLVIGGLTEGSPYAESVGFTRPYRTCGEEAHVVAGPPGENRWLMTVEAYVLDAGAAVACPGGEVTT